MDGDQVLAGITFVKEYYDIMLNYPSKLHGYYRESSMSWSLAYGDRMSTNSASSMTGIKEIISSLAYNIRKIEILSLTAVNKRINDVVMRIAVTGLLTRVGDSNQRKFTHNFQLGSYDRGLYVKHDSFTLFLFKDSCGVSQKANSGNVVGKGKGHSVYIRDLPQSATPADLQTVFSPFGHILQAKVEKVEMKEYFSLEFHYGLVTFQDFASMENALKNPPVTICGKPVSVEPIAETYPMDISKRDVNRSLLPFRDSWGEAC